MNGSIFQNLAKFEPKLAQINWADWYMNGLLFLEKTGIFVWVYFLNSVAAHPYQNQT